MIPTCLNGSIANFVLFVKNTIITARKRSLRRLCFYTCLSFCPREGGGWWYSSMHHRSHDPPQTDTPPGQTPPWADTPLG